MMLFIGEFGIVEMLFILIPIILWLWALIDVIKSNFNNATLKNCLGNSYYFTSVCWIFVILLHW